MARDFRLDMVRSLACVIVVLTHILQAYGNPWCYWTNSAVCTFFLLSGVLVSKAEITSNLSWLTKKLKKLLLPYYLIAIPAISMFLLFFVINIKEILAILLDLTALAAVPKGFRHLWFMTGIAISYGLTPMLLNTKKNSLFYWLGRGFVVGVLFILYLRAPSLALGMVCYFVGMLGAKYIVVYDRKRYATVLFLSSAFFLINFIFKKSEVLALIRYPLFGFALFYWVYHAKGINDFFEKYQKSVIQVLAKYSYFIYLIHGFFCIRTRICSIFNPV